MPAVIKADPSYRAKWKEACAWLHEMGVLTTADRDVLTMYVTSVCDYAAAMKLCRTKGRYTTNAAGTAVRAPWDVAASDHFQKFFKAAPRLGLTIVDREKLAGLVKPDSDADELKA
jgi:P27 family predicted phage terminase small subunit